MTSRSLSGPSLDGEDLMQSQQHIPKLITAGADRFIFAQGVVDAVIYGLIEWRTKKVVRRKLKKGALSGGGSRGSRSVGDAPGTGSRTEAAQVLATTRKGWTRSRNQMSSLEDRDSQNENALERQRASASSWGASKQ